MSWLNKLFGFFFGFYVVFIGLHAATHPHYNWDVVGYTGAVYALHASDPIEVHQRTYGELRAALPDSVYGLLTSSTNSYRYAMATNAEAFYAELSLYSVKPLYVFLLDALRAGGLSVAESSVLLSVLFSSALIVVVLFWMRRLLPDWRAYVVAPALCTIATVPDLARTSSPDALSSFIVVLAFLLLIEKKQFHAPFLLVIAALFLRTDSIVLLFLLLIVPGMSTPYKSKIRWLLLYGFTGLLVFLTIHIMNTEYIWNRSSYGLTLIHGITHLMINDVYSMLPIFLCLSILTAWLGRRSLRQKMNDAYWRLNLLAFSVVVCHLVLFPVISDRFFVSYYLAIGLALIATLISSRSIDPGQPIV